MRWKVHGRRTMYESDWVNVYLDDVELPNGNHIDHHVVTMPKASQTAIVLDKDEKNVLLIRRHRFITDKWGWEVPAGWVEPGEEPEESIRREILEETGYEVSAVEPMVEYDAIPGLSTMHFTAWRAIGTSKIAESDGIEATEIAWKPVEELRQSLLSGEISDGPSLLALAYFLSTDSKMASEGT